MEPKPEQKGKARYVGVCLTYTYLFIFRHGDTVFNLDLLRNLTSVFVRMEMALSPTASLPG